MFARGGRGGDCAYNAFNKLVPKPCDGVELSSSSGADC